MTKYRPEGWEEIKDRIIDKYTPDDPFYVPDVVKAVDGTADAMLEALKRTGQRVDVKEWPGGNCYATFLLRIPAKGTLVFIPDDKE